MKLDIGQAIDLSEIAGFPLFFNPGTLDVTSADSLRFETTTRRVVDLSEVLQSPGELSANKILYYTLETLPVDPEVRSVLDRSSLIYGLVLLPALTIGREYVKTHGHYHPPVPGGRHEFPEVYTQLYGKLLLLLQKRRESDPDQLEDCAIAVMTPGYKITIPPGYAHVLINPTHEPALMAGLYGRNFKPDYAPVRSRHGLAYFVLDQDGSMQIQKNQNYSLAPELRWLVSLDGTPFEPPDPGLPMWSAYFANPDKYTFLTEPEAVLAKFGGGEGGT